MNAKKFETSVIIIFIFHRNSRFESVFLFFTAQKMKFSIADLVTFTEEILNGKLHFFCSVLVDYEDHIGAKNRVDFL